jgi:hypothetical protein
MQTSNLEAPHFWRPCSSAQVARPWGRACCRLRLLFPAAASNPRPSPSPADFSTPAATSFPDRLHRRDTAAASTAADATGTKRVGSAAGLVTLDASSAPTSPFLRRLSQVPCRRRRGGSSQIELVGRQIDGRWLRIGM